jgi:hypothetical protein
MRVAAVGISRSEGRCVWSACRWESSTMSAWAACRGGTWPRTRRRWPTRAVITGSNRKVVPLSCPVMVLWPHQVTVPVTACPSDAARALLPRAGFRPSWRCGMPAARTSASRVAAVKPRHQSLRSEPQHRMRAARLSALLRSSTFAADRPGARLGVALCFPSEGYLTPQFPAPHQAWTTTRQAHLQESPTVSRLQRNC